MKSVLVEFVGAAGVGKSYVLGALSRSLSHDRIEYTNLDTTRINMLRFGHLYLVANAAYLSCQVRPASIRQYPSAFNRLARLAIRNKYVRASGGLHICSEGVFHRIRRLTRERVDLSMIEVAERVLHYITPPDIVVVLEATASTIYHRRTQRNRIGDIFDCDSVTADVQLIADSKDTIQHVKRTSAPDLIALTFDTECHDVESIVASVSVAIREIVAMPFDSLETNAPR